MLRVLFLFSAIAIIFVGIVFAGGSDQPYTRFPTGYYYWFNGIINCANGNEVGENAEVTLIEMDAGTPMDFVDVTGHLKNNKKISLQVDADYDDFPTPTLELFIRFEKCCGYTNYKLSGFLKNGSNWWTSYTLIDNDLYAVVYGKRKSSP